MAAQAENVSDRPPDGSGVTLSEEQRAVFRSAGTWMGILGGAEVLVGALGGVAWLLGAFGVAPPEGRPSPGDWVLTALLAIGTVGIGILTLIAAASFRRAGRVPDAGLAAVTTAVSDLRELYERQVWVTLILLAIAIGGAFLWR